METNRAIGLIHKKALLWEKPPVIYTAAHRTQFGLNMPTF